MLTVGVDSGSLRADSQPKSVGTQSVFIEWAMWILAVAQLQWQHCKHCLWYYYCYYY